MNFLNTATTQLRDLLQSMTPGARILAGLLLAVFFVSLGFLFQHRAAAPDVYLFGGKHLPASQLDRMEAAIAKRGLSGQHREGNQEGKNARGGNERRPLLVHFTPISESSCMVPD